MKEPRLKQAWLRVQFRRMMSTGCMLLGCCFAFTAQAQDNHLEPAAGYFSHYSYQNTYYPNVQRTLQTAMNDKPMARVVVLPSHEPEYILSIEQSGQQYFLIYNRAQRNIHSSSQDKSKKSVPVDSKRVALRQPLAAALATLWNTAIQQTCYPEPSMRMRNDGTTFCFVAFRPGIGPREGQTWSPSKGSHMAALVGIVEELLKLAATPEDQELHDKLLQETVQLNQQLQTL